MPKRLSEFPSKLLIESMFRDKKAENENIKFILTRDIGSIEIVDRIEESILKKSLDEFQRFPNGN